MEIPADFVHLPEDERRAIYFDPNASIEDKEQMRSIYEAGLEQEKAQARAVFMSDVLIVE